MLRAGVVDDELTRELAFHLDALVDEKLRDGMTLEDARAAARRDIGNVAVVEEQCRDVRRVSWLHDLQQDLRLGLRMLRKTPVFSAIAIGSLAIVIGINAAVLGAMYAMLVQPPAFPGSDRVVSLTTIAPGDPKADGAGITSADFYAWSDGNRVFETMAASLGGEFDLDPDIDGLPGEQIVAPAVTPTWFWMLGVAPELGRTFTDEEGRPDNRDRVMVISHRLWVRRFNSDPQVIGRTAGVNGGPTRIVGVMPEGFEFHDRRADAWRPFRISPQMGGAGRWIVMAALAKHATIDDAAADLTRLGAGRTREAPAVRPDWQPRVRPIGAALYGWSAAPLMTYVVAAAALLFVTCANLAGVLLARGTLRRPEMALRTALGARRGRLVRQWMAETWLMSLAGGAAGLLVAALTSRALVWALSPPLGVPRMPTVGLTAVMVAVAFGLACLTGPLVGLGPALLSTRRERTTLVRDSASLATSFVARQQWARATLVVAQVALALVLATGAGLLLTSQARLLSRDLHFERRGLISFAVRTPALAFIRPVPADRGGPYVTIDRGPADRLQQMYERLRTMPGVTSVAGISFPPVNSIILPRVVVRPIVRDVRVSSSPPDRIDAAYFLITPDFFATIQTPIVRGREFDARDTALAPWGAIVNETTARMLWPGRDPVGQFVQFDAGPDERAREVIGVVSDIPTRRGLLSADPVVYASTVQQPSRFRGSTPGMFGQMTFVVRHPDQAAFVRMAAPALASIDPHHPMAAIGTIDNHINAQMFESSNYVMLLGVFAIAAVVLASIGIHGVVAYSVSQRMREIGIRKALGAQPQDVLALIGRRALGVVATGLAIGVVAAVALTPLIERQLWNTSATDPITFAAAAAGVAAVTIAACILPARRAVRVDPARVLNEESGTLLGRAG